MTAVSRGLPSPDQIRGGLSGPASLDMLRQHGRFALGTIFAVLLVVVWRAMQHYPTALNDLYPLYYGAQAWLHSGNAYDLASVAPVEHQPYPLFEIGNPYPLPAVLLVLPLSFLPPTLAAMVWLGGLVAALLVALRLNGWPSWLLFYVPVVNAIYAEQFTLFILVLQILALWAYRTDRPWLLAICCVLILTKPNQGLFFVLALILLSRHWRQCLAVGAVVWGGSLLLDPHWVGQWLAMLSHHHEMTQQPLLWGLAFFAIPLLLIRDYISAAVMLQFLVMPYPFAAYPFSPVPLGLLGEARHRWLIPVSFIWMLIHFAIGEVWASLLTLILPVVALSLWRYWRERRAAAPADTNLAPAGA